MIIFHFDTSPADLKNLCYALSMEGVTVDVHYLECRVTFDR